MHMLNHSWYSIIPSWINVVCISVKPIQLSEHTVVSAEAVTVLLAVTSFFFLFDWELDVL